MATIYGDPDILASGSLARERRLDACLRALQDCGWERLQPLAQHMAERRLVRARGDAGAQLRHLDVLLLWEALGRMLRDDDDDGYLIFQLVVQGTDPALVAAERGISRSMLVQQLRDAVGSLACAYEDTAYQGLVETQEERMRAAPARQCG